MAADDPWAVDPRPTLCLDFDGVLHSYVSGWKGADVIPDPPVEGAIEWLEHMTRDDAKFQVCIYSSRSKQEGGIDAMLCWLEEHGATVGCMTRLGFPTQKPPTFLTIDDRAFCFIGKFPPEDELINFKPWNKKTAEGA